jgi:predicted phosphoribosyltransferase
VFANREDAGLRLAPLLKSRELYDPLVLAIPRGGVVVGAALARELDAALDVFLARKLRVPEQPELAIGAISETGHVYLRPDAEDVLLARETYLTQERRRQMAEIGWRQRLYREGRPPAPIAGRSIIVTDDGVVTGSTLAAALQVVRSESPRQVLVAVPVAPASALTELRHWCDEILCPLIPPVFVGVGQAYEDFSPVDDDQVVARLRAYAGHRGTCVVST